MAHACDRLPKASFHMRYGNSNVAATLSLYQQPYGECCLKVGDIALRASKEFNLPIHCMKLAKNHQIMMGDFNKDKDLKLSDVGFTKGKTEKISIYGRRPMWYEDPALIELCHLERFYNATSRQLCKLLAEAKNIEQRQGPVVYTLFGGKLLKRDWLNVQEQGIKLKDNFSAIKMRSCQLRFHPSNVSKATPILNDLLSRSSRGAEQSEQVVETVRQVFAKRYNIIRHSFLHTNGWCP